MADDLEARLTAAAAVAREHEITLQWCREVERRLLGMTERVTELQEEAAAEHRDVRRLEGITLTRVLASLRGARDDRLARERAEAEMAALRVQDAEAMLAATHRELEGARTRLHMLAEAPATYGAVLDEKERYLHASADPRSPRILQLADERGRIISELTEIDQALRAAANAHRALVNVQSRLGSASSWSTFDLWLGGFISSAIKHDRLDAAADAAASADHYLMVLRTELADVGGPAARSAPQLEMSGLTRFLDVWFDNVFTDLAVSNRIEQAKANVTHCLDFVDHVRERLRQTASQLHQRVQAIEEERHHLLTRDPV